MEHTKNIDDLPRVPARRLRSALLAFAAALPALSCVGSATTYSQTGFASDYTSYTEAGSPQANLAQQSTFVPSLPVSHAPFHDLNASWMQRLDQPYVYVDHFGSYTETGAHLPSLLREMRVQGIEPDGPPFCLFYDDPAMIPAGELRSRACVPIRAPRSPRSPLGYDVLASRTVAYAFVSGPYPDVPLAYPKLFEYMSKMNWEAAGPIRETYIIPPASANGPRELLCEIQIPTQVKGY